MLALARCPCGAMVCFASRLPGATVMTPAEQQQEIEDLCRAVIHEKNPAKLTKLIAQLNELLERRDRKLAEGDSPTRDS
jgi:hypothetical protein